MPKNPQYHSPQVPLVQTTPRLEQLRGSFFLSGLVFRPRFPPISHSVVLFMLVWWRLLPATVWNKSGENKYRLDAEFFEDAKVRLNTRHECEG